MPLFKTPTQYPGTGTFNRHPHFQLCTTMPEKSLSEPEGVILIRPDEVPHIFLHFRSVLYRSVAHRLQ